MIYLNHGLKEIFLSLFKSFEPGVVSGFGNFGIQQTNAKMLQKSQQWKKRTCTTSQRVRACTCRVIQVQRGEQEKHNNLNVVLNKSCGFFFVLSFFPVCFFWAERHACKYGLQLCSLWFWMKLQFGTELF